MSLPTYTLDGRTFTILFPDLLRSLTDQESADLEKAISEDGVTTPILIDEEDGVINGHNRLRIACKLRLSTIKTSLLTGLTHGQKKKIAWDSNAKGRQLTQDEIAAGNAEAARGQQEEHIAKTGVPQSARGVARATGLHVSTVLKHCSTVDPSTVEQEPEGPVAKAMDARGCLRTVRKLSAEEIEARQANVAALADQGYKNRQIAEMLGIGNGTVSTDLRKFRARQAENS